MGSLITNKQTSQSDELKQISFKRWGRKGPHGLGVRKTWPVLGTSHVMWGGKERTMGFCTNPHKGWRWSWPKTPWMHCGDHQEVNPETGLFALRPEWRDCCQQPYCRCQRHQIKMAPGRLVTLALSQKQNGADLRKLGLQEMVSKPGFLFSDSVNEGLQRPPCTAMEGGLS